MFNKSMEERFIQLEAECHSLNQKLIQQNELKDEVEALKEELEKSLEIHKKLQEVALAFEEENRTMTKKYNCQLKEKANLDVMKIELEQEIESKCHNYKNLEKRYNKIKEKVGTFDNLEDKVYSFEKENKRYLEKIKDLEETVAAYEKGNASRGKKSEDKLNKLIKENNELSLKLETYEEEMEELDIKNENLEKENNDFKEQFERLKDIEIIGSSIQQIQKLESKITTLEERLKKEEQKREIVENELFKVEEEYENFKIKIESRDETNLEYTKISRDETDGESGESSDVILRRKQMVINNLDAERNELQTKIQTFEQDHQVLLDENNELAKLNLQHEQKKKELFEEKRKVREIHQEEILKLKEEISCLNEKLNEENESDEKNETENKIIEVERLKNELKLTQDYLRSATDQHADLQVQIKEMEKDHNEKLLKLQEYYENLKEEEQNNLINEIAIKFDHERSEYENRILDMTAVIGHLEERISSLKNFYETKSVSMEGSTPSPESTPPVALKNGKYHDSIDELRDYNYNGFQRRNAEESDEELDEDTLSDRELRRIAYKIADGNWSDLETDLGVSAQDLSLIRRGAANDQEKVYRLLVSWRSELNLSRTELLKRLCDHIDPKRKDIIKFLKEMAGISGSEGLSVKKRFRKFTQSMKR